MEPAVLAKTVVKHFIMNYYQVLHDTPDQLHKFYKEDSVFCVGTEGVHQPDDRIVGPENIHQKILSLGFTNCKVRLSVVEAQDSVEGSILVLVKGSLTNNDGSPTDFIQTFLLAVQQPSGYYVRNDIMRYLATPAASTHTTSSASAPATSKHHQDAASEKKVEDTHTPHRDTAPSANGTAEHKPEAAHQEPPAQQQTLAPAPVSAPTQSTPAPAPTHAPATTAPEVTEKATPKEEPRSVPAEVEKPVANHNNVDEKDAEPPTKTAPTKAADSEKTGSSSWAALAARAAPLQPQPQARPPPAAVKKPKPVEEEHEHRPQASGITSLYVSNLPFSTTKSQIDSIFGVYGEIKVTALPAGKGFAFIEYVSPESVTKAVAATTAQPIVLEGRRLNAEPRKKQHGKDRQGGRRVKDRRDGGEHHADKDAQGTGGEQKEKKFGSAKQRPGGGSDRENRPRGQKKNPQGGGGGGGGQGSGRNGGSKREGGGQGGGGGGGQGGGKQHASPKQN